MSFWCHHLDQNSNENIVRISALEFFEASWGLSGDLVSNIINKEAYRKPQGSYKNFQGRNPYNIYVAILVKTITPKRHFEINWPLVWGRNQVYCACCFATYCGAKIFNSLSIKIRETQDSIIFKKLVKNWIWDEVPSYCQIIDYIL